MLFALVLENTKMISGDGDHDDGSQDDDQNYGLWLEMKMVKAT